MEERFNILALIEAARTLEKYLWGEQNDKWGLEEWKRMLRKRMAKLELIDTTLPHWEVEMKKRLLQLSSVSVACMTAMDEGKLIQDKNPALLESNLPDYAKFKQNAKLANEILEKIFQILVKDRHHTGTATLVLEAKQYMEELIKNE